MILSSSSVRGGGMSVPRIFLALSLAAAAAEAEAVAAASAASSSSFLAIRSASLISSSSSSSLAKELFVSSDTSIFSAWSSSYVPWKTTPRSFTTMMWSARGRNWTWCVTRTRVRPSRAPQMHSSIKATQTCESTALSGSSMSTISRPLYTARAKATRCFWPPERLIPRSPISVWSEAVSWCKSAISCESLMTSMYFFSSKGMPIKMLSRSVAFMIQASCATRAVRPLMTTSLPSLTMASPDMSEISVDLPLPVGPMTMVSFPRGILMLMSFMASSYSLRLNMFEKSMLEGLIGGAGSSAFLFLLLSCFLASMGGGAVGVISTAASVLVEARGN
eukprot:PhM_4_TR15927/c0_g1_i1/m.43480